MERVRRLQQIWNWLPAFRAVAETEHLPTAAERLFVTPPALSRSIKQLEEQLETTLFDRVGRRLRLNAAGQELLSAVRDAMRRLDDGVGAVSGHQLVGPIHVAAPMPFHSFVVLPALTPITAQHPRLVPHLSSVGAKRANSALLAGQLDVALLDDPVPHPELLIDELAPIRYGVYCGRSHPLADRRSLSDTDLAAHPFAAPPEGFDHWPVGRARQVGLVLSHLYLGVEAAASDRYLAVLPEWVARFSPHSERLVRLPFDAFEPAALFAVRRPPLSDGGRAELVLNAIRRRLTEL